MYPNPLVAGQGAQIIKDAGKDAILFSRVVDPSEGLLTPVMSSQQVKLLSEQLEIVAENFFKNFCLKKSFIALKWAQSIDGKMALSNYQSQWITSSESRNYTHYLRSIYDVMIVGAGTVLKDNPKLNIRLDGVSKENRILIIDPNAVAFKALDNLELSKHHKKENIFFVVDANSADTAVAFDVAVNPPGTYKNVLFLQRNSNGRFSLEAIHDFCFERGMKSILVEGGPSTLNEYFEQKAFDRVYTFIAPIFLGNGLGYSHKLSVPSMAQKLQLSAVEKINFADDILITGIRPVI